MNEISTAVLEAVKNSTHAARLEEALRLIRVAEAERTSGIELNGGMDEAPIGLIEMLDAGIQDANDAALWAADELRTQLEDVSQHFGMFFSSNWGEGGDFAVFVAPEMGWLCQPSTQVAGFNK